MEGPNKLCQCCFIVCDLCFLNDKLHNIGSNEDLLPWNNRDPNGILTPFSCLSRKNTCGMNLGWCLTCCNCYCDYASDCNMIMRPIPSIEYFICGCCGQVCALKGNPRDRSGWRSRLAGCYKTLMYVNLCVSWRCFLGLICCYQDADADWMKGKRSVDRQDPAYREQQDARNLDAMDDDLDGFNY